MFRCRPRTVGAWGLVLCIANVLSDVALRCLALGLPEDPLRRHWSGGFDFFISAYGAKYDKAAERTVKDRERLLISYDFPVERVVAFAHNLANLRWARRRFVTPVHENGIIAKQIYEIN